MPIRAIVIDLEGVIINIDYQLTFSEFAKLGIRVNYDGVFKILVENYDSGMLSTHAMYRNFCTQYCPAANWPPFSLFVKAWNAMLLYIPDHRLEYLFRLKQQGIKIVLLSNINELHAMNVHRTYGGIFKKLFDKILYSFQTRILKPERQSFQFAIDFLRSQNIQIQEIVFVDDTRENTDAARECGLESIRFVGAHHLKLTEELRFHLEPHMPLMHKHSRL